jgi:hypothetical protein
MGGRGGGGRGERGRWVRKVLSEGERGDVEEDKEQKNGRRSFWKKREEGGSREEGRTKEGIWTDLSRVTPAPKTQRN